MSLDPPPPEYYVKLPPGVRCRCHHLYQLRDNFFCCDALDAESRKYNTSGEALKNDWNKLPLHLLPFDALEGIAEILQLGAIKYGERNWEKGTIWSRTLAATLRHLFAWALGEDLDKETGKSHLLHAGCEILFLIAFERRGVGKDDRPRNNPKEVELSATTDRPVAWRVKDYADGWIIFSDEEEARREAERGGGIKQGLYIRDIYDKG